MKWIIAEMPDLSVVVARVNPSVLPLLMNGGVFGTDPSAEQLEREVQKFLLPDANGNASKITESIARQWVNALAFGGLTEAQAYALIAQKDCPGCVSSDVVLRDNVLAMDRTFRNAWRRNMSYDMPTCRVIHRNRLRDMREPKMRLFDIQWMRAIAIGDSVAAAAAEDKRQELRDATQYPAIDAATTPVELKAAIPPILQNLQNLQNA